MTDAEIEVMRNNLNGMPGLETKTVEKIVDAMKTYRENPVNRFCKFDSKLM